MFHPSAWALSSQKPGNDSAKEKYSFEDFKDRNLKSLSFSVSSVYWERLQKCYVNSLQSLSTVHLHTNCLYNRHAFQCLLLTV